jgi:hypothetical protein
MIDIFNKEYTEVMKKALETYRDSLEEDHPDLKSIKLMLISLDQLPELMKLFQNGNIMG